MQFYHSSSQDQFGNAVAAATVNVFSAGTTTLATIYSDNGVTLTANPMTSDALGRFQFYAADGKYDITVSGNTITTYTIQNVILFDNSASTGALGVGFLQSGTGATATTTQAELRRIVWVEQFGAKGDGTTDDAANIQKAHDYVYGLGGGEVRFLSATYKIGSGLTIKQGVRFIGKSMWGTTIKGTFAETLVQFTSSSSGEILTGVFLENMTVDGGAVGNGGTGTLMMTPTTGGASSRQCGLRNVRIQNCATGLALRAHQDFEAENCKFISNTTGVDVSTNESVTGTPQMARFTSCDFRSNAKGIAGTYTAGSKPIVYHFHRCHFEVNTTHGIDASAVAGTQWLFSSCKWEQNGTTAINMTGCEQFQFDNCDFYNNSNTTNTAQIFSTNGSLNGGGGHSFKNCAWGGAASAVDYNFTYVPDTTFDSCQFSTNGATAANSDIRIDGTYRGTLIRGVPAKVIQRRVAYWIDGSQSVGAFNVAALPNSSSTYGNNGVLWVDRVQIHVTVGFTLSSGTTAYIQVGINGAAQFISQTQDVTTTGLKTPTLNNHGYSTGTATQFVVTLGTDGGLAGAGKALVMIDYSECPLSP